MYTAIYIYVYDIHTLHTHMASQELRRHMGKESKISRPVGNLICKSYANQGLALCNSASGQRDFHGITLDSTAKYIIILY